jgi:two-component system, sensor histidine kinase PdtaS
VDFPLRRSSSRPGGVRTAIALLVLIPVLVPLFAALLIWLGERDSTAAANDRVMAAARVASADVRELVDTTLQRLERYDQQLGQDPTQFRPPRSSVEQGFVALYDADGLVVGPDGQRTTSIASNAEFKVLANGKPWVITPMLGNASSLRIFGIARRVERDGRFAGVITAYLPADALSQTWGEADLGEQSTIGVVREDGWMVARYPLPDEATNIARTLLFEEAAKAAEGSYVSQSSPIDSIARRVGYISIPDLGVIVTASMSRTSMTDEFWSRVGYTALVAAPVFITMVLLCGWAIVLLIRHDRNRVQLELALERNRMLFQEIHHRVKNNLQQVAAMVRLQQAPAAMKEDLTRRIVAMSAVHQHIYESDQFGVLDAEAYLARVLTGLRDAGPPGVTLEWKLAPLQLSPDQALPLGMIVNEIVSNAFKHGFPEGRAGLVSVTLQRPLAGNEAVLTVADNGVGMGETPSGGIGLGTRLIAGLAQQLGGKTTVIRDGGVRTELRFPVTPTPSAN